MSVLEETINLHYFIYVIMGFIILYLFTRKSYRPRSPVVLTPTEVHELLTTWKPTPMVPEINQLQRFNIEHIDCISEVNQNRVKLADDQKDYLNFASQNFFGYASKHELIEKVSLETLHECGVGSCGPRQFYGTFDHHLKFEAQIAKFFGYDEAILYASGFATLTSVIPAFIGRDDFILCDQQVKLAIQIGNYASRATVKYYRPNDLNHLEQLMCKVKQNENVKRAKSRVYVITEGIFQNTGNICPLKEIVSLCKLHGCRIILDDSVAIGVLGATGRGTLEHFHLKPSSVSHFCADVSLGLASLGGICCGSSRIVRFQRLNGSGYMYSASNPPLLVRGGYEALKDIDEHPDKVHEVQEKSRLLHSRLREIEQLEVEGFELSPFAVFRLKPHLREGDAYEDSVKLQTILEKTKERGFLISRSKFAPNELFPPEPQLRASVMIQHTNQEIDQFANALREAIVETLQ